MAVKEIKENLEIKALYLSAKTNLCFDIALLYLKLENEYYEAAEKSDIEYDELECCNYVCKKADLISPRDFFILSRAEIQYYFDNGNFKHIKQLDFDNIKKQLDFDNIKEQEIKLFINEYNNHFNTTIQ